MFNMSNVRYIYICIISTADTIMCKILKMMEPHNLVSDRDADQVELTPALLVWDASIKTSSLAYSATMHAPL